MRLSCGRLKQCGVRSDCLSTNCGSIKIRPVCFCPQFSLPSNNMSAPAKSTTPIAPAVVESKDWTKATTPELQSGSEDGLSVLDAKAKEHRRRKQVRREERQRREAEERRAREEAERKAREQAEAERKAREQAEKERAESQQRKAAEEAAKQRAVEVATKQKTTAQDALKKRAREEPEAGLVGEVR